MRFRTGIVIVFILSILSGAIFADDLPEFDRGASLFDTVGQGGFLMIPLLLLGLLGLTLIVERGLFFLRTKTYNAELIKEHLKQAKEKSTASHREELDDELREQARLYINRMEKGLPLLNGVGNLAPLMGFFGTVVGMIEAFAAIAAATTVNAKVVAIGIQVALVTTAGGLAVAVPTLMAFYFYVHIIQRVSSHADEYIVSLADGKPRLAEGN